MQKSKRQKSEMDISNYYENLRSRYVQRTSVCDPAGSGIKNSSQELSLVLQEIKDGLDDINIEVLRSEELYTELQNLRGNLSRITAKLQLINSSIKCPSPVKSLEEKEPCASGVDQGSSSQTVQVDSELQKKDEKRLCEYLTSEEYAAIPKYMKGRITYEKLKIVVDAFNQTLEAKYKLLEIRKPLYGKLLEKIRNYKKQECSETRGYLFCTDDDLEEISNLKLDTQMKNCLTILRHCKRIKDVRSAGNIVRHLLL